jgi:Helix-turn-helix domain
MSPFGQNGHDTMVTQMSDKEVLRSQLMGQLVEGKLSQKEAAERLGVTVRQVKRLKRCYVAGGVAGLVSAKRGRPSNRRLDAALLSKAMALVGAHYADFGPTLAAEKLRELHGVTLSVETVRQQMIAHGYWKSRRTTTVRAHPMRERRLRRGELIQIDGSPHDWFEGRAPRCTLLVFIDDATGELTHLQFVDTETTLDYMAALQRHIELHGLPAALYSDRHSIFRVNHVEAAAGAQTQFARALKELGVEGIHANSPQAKGRVERANQTLQDRLVKEMRLQGISGQFAANAWLPSYIAEFNGRFCVPAVAMNDAHVPYLGKPEQLRRILSVQNARKLSKNLSCQHDGIVLQVKTASSGLSMRGAAVMVHRHQDGEIEVRWQGRTLLHDMSEPVPRCQRPAADGKQVNTLVDNIIATRAPQVPHIGHPWKKAMPKLDVNGKPPKAMF